MDTKKLVPLKTFDNELDADVAKQHLLSHGIQAVVTKDDCGGMRPWMQQHQGVVLQVFEADSTKASKVLKAMRV